MKRQAFVFHDTSWKVRGQSPLDCQYAEWINDLLAKYPNATFEFHQSLGSFFWELQESDWVQLLCLVIVTEQE